ncbi:6219_t:CDS:2 [Paraglomus occultum]|uniref:6219_t:CDS:1 n=1 Tax=Paraglomus occultum TaxID=144539 RepID=A0A9N8VSN8_9GLOM|nr:6219_t:CDS:2 [Paraglomus occultum]
MLCGMEALGQTKNGEKKLPTDTIYLYVTSSSLLLTDNSAAVTHPVFVIDRHHLEHIFGFPSEIFPEDRKDISPKDTQKTSRKHLAEMSSEKMHQCRDRPVPQLRANSSMRQTVAMEINYSPANRAALSVNTGTRATRTYQESKQKCHGKGKKSSASE